MALNPFESSLVPIEKDLGWWGNENAESECPRFSMEKGREFSSVVSATKFQSCEMIISLFFVSCRSCPVFPCCVSVHFGHSPSGKNAPALGAIPQLVHRSSRRRLSPPIQAEERCDAQDGGQCLPATCPDIGESCLQGTFCTAIFRQSRQSRQEVDF